MMMKRSRPERNGTARRLGLVGSLVVLSTLDSGCQGGGGLQIQGPGLSISISFSGAGVTANVNGGPGGAPGPVGNPLGGTNPLQGTQLAGFAPNGAAGPFNPGQTPTSLPGGLNPGQTPNLGQTPNPSVNPNPVQTPGPTGGIDPAAAAALDRWPGGQLPPSQFFALLAPAALQAQRQSGVPAAVTLAQAALETGYGRSTIGSAKNLFGIKGTGPAGTVNANTREVFNGNSVRVNDGFRAYNTWTESLLDHNRLLTTNARYRPAFRYTNDPEQFAREIHRAGYATDPEYSTKLVQIMRENNLLSLQA